MTNIVNSDARYRSFFASLVRPLYLVIAIITHRDGLYQSKCANKWN